MKSDKPNIDLHRRASRYAIAVGAVALGTLLRYGMNVWAGPLPTYITFYPAVMLAALLGGFWPGIVATLLVDVVADYWLLPPVGFGIASFSDAAGLGLFSLMGVFMSTVAELYRHARVKAAAYDQEVALREISRDKEFLASILERASQPFAVGYPDGRLGLINNAFEKLTGYTKDELKSIDWDRVLTPPEWWDIEQEKIDYLNRTGQPIRYEKEYIRKDGTRVPIELLVHLVTDSEGKPEYYYSFITDITERKQAEEKIFVLNRELKHTVEELEAVFDAVPIGIAIAEDPQGYHIRGNPANEQLLGVMRGGELSLVPGLDRAAAGFRALQDGRELAIEELPMQRAVRGEIVTGQILDVVRQDGRVVNLYSNAVPLYDEQDRPRGAVGAFLDITELRQAEEALRRAKDELELRVQERTAELSKVNELLWEEIEKRKKAHDMVVKQTRLLQTFFKSTITPLIFLDKNFNFIRVNEAYARACQREEQEFPGRNHFELYPNEENQRIFEQVVATGEIYQAVARPFVFPDHPEWGTTYWDWNLTPLLTENNEVEFLVFSLKDVTEKIRAEQEQQKATAEIHDLYNNAPCGYHSLDGDGTFVRMNNTELSWLGYALDEILGKKKFSDLLTPASQEVFKESFPRFKERGIVTDLEFEMIRRDGTILPVNLNATAVTDSAGNYVMSRSTVFDITERMKAQESIYRLNRMYLLLSQINEAIILINDRDQLFSEICRLAVETGRFRMAWIGMVDPVTQILCPTTHKGVEEDYLKNICVSVADVPEGRGPTGRAVREGRCVACNDILIDPAMSPWRAEALRRGYCSSSAVPINSGSRSIGALTVYAVEPHFFDREELELLGKIGLNLSFALKALDEEEQRQLAEKAQRESEARFRSLIQTAPVVIISLSPEGTILEFNPEAELVYGRTREEVLGKNYLDLFIADEYRVRMADRIKRILNGEEFLSTEMPIRHADGTRRYYLWNADRILDQQGVPYGIITVGYDITERKRMENDLESAARYSRSLIEASLDPLVTINTNGQIMDANGATERITGLRREQLIGSDFSNYFTEPEKAKKGYEAVFRNGFARNYPLVIKDVSGKTRDVLYNATVYRNKGGEVQGVFAAARDITKRKRAEGRLRESEERLKFLSSELIRAQETERKRIASELHDSIASSLSAVILGLVRASRQLPEGTQGHELITRAITMVQHTVEETRRMMNLLRPPMLDDLGLLPAITWFLDQYSAIYSGLAINKDIAVEDAEIPVNMKIDLYRIIQEAFTNIAKHSNANAAELSLKKKDDVIELTIADNGQGFNPDAGPAANRGKSGLGLISMKERAELAGGTMIIQSIAGKGTTVCARWSAGV